MRVNTEREEGRRTPNLHCIQYENAQVEEKVAARIKIIFIHFGNT